MNDNALNDSLFERSEQDHDDSLDPTIFFSVLRRNCVCVGPSCELCGSANDLKGSIRMHTYTIMNIGFSMFTSPVDIVLNRVNCT